MRAAGRRGALRGRSTIDVEFPFHPHVTVAHHLPDDRLDQAFVELARFECAFDVPSFHLYVHDAADGLAADP